MTDEMFPTLKELGRPDTILDCIMANPSGLVIVSGKRYSGVTTTIAALGHEMKDSGFNTVYLSNENSDHIPFLDSISAEDSDSLKEYFAGPYPPDVAIFDVDHHIPSYRLAAAAAQAGILSIVAITSDSYEDASSRFTRLVSDTEFNEYMITVSIHHIKRPAVRDYWGKPVHAYLESVSRADELLQSVNPARKRVIDTGSTDTVFEVQQF